MATADPASSSCKDAPLPWAWPFKMPPGVVFISYLWKAPCTRPHSRRDTAGAPVPVPFLLVAGDMKHKVCPLPGGHALLSQTNARTVKALSQQRTFISVSRGGEEEEIIE